MNDPNNFNQDQNGEQKDARNDAPFSDNPQQYASDMPLWYSVSYTNNGGYSVPGEIFPIDPVPPKRRKRRVVLLVSLLVVAAILLSTLMGVGAYFLTKHLDTNVPNDNTGNLSNSNTNGLGDAIQSSAHEYTDKNYAFAAAFDQLSKNSGTALAGSENGSAGANKMSLIAATAAVKDSVVEITTTIVSNRGGTMTAGAGSGVIIHKDGIIVTNNHVIEGCDKIYVRLTDGDTYEAALRGVDEDGDIAILKITPQASKPLTVAKLGSSKSLALGEEVIAIGNPLGELGGTVTNGIISATEREINADGTKMKLLQTNAAINSGNSGGGLFNLAGELIGVVNAKYAAAGVEGLGFAIPIDTAYEKSIKDILQVGYVRGLPALGVKLVEKTGTKGSFPFVSTIYGASVYDPPANSQFKDGDYIYSIEENVVYGISTSALDAIKPLVRAHKVGDVISVVVLRDDEKITLSVTLSEYVPEDNLQSLQ